MFLFDKIPWYSALMALILLTILILINEITRKNKWCAISVYIILPIVLTFSLWPKTAGAGSSVGYWFPWVKTYSALAGVIGFMALRYVKGLDKNKLMLMFPPFILALNILEAVYRDFQCFGIQGVENGLVMIGGPWNIINGIAGILNIVTLTGWCSIFISKSKSKDMIWPDQLWFWIIAYDLWNFSYTYNCISDRSFYVGFILLLSCTIPAFFIKKGAWLQHRAQTLALYTMFTLTIPTFADSSRFAVKSSHNTNVLLIVSILSLIANASVLIYEIKRINQHKLNPLKDDIYFDLKVYKDVISENK
ncbi:DUF5692 family protein [Clostridium amazonitimonense]|uniref:DUF5692 family protein n=1 Tax=Clostridium amazonitimonense TaxID=1499689 RepID=UPI000509A502|nr:DUF5692 family protein [Clostridium amazonitimonense]